MWFRKTRARKAEDEASKLEVLATAIADQKRTEDLLEYVKSNTSEVETMANTLNGRVPKNHFVASLRLTMGEGAKPA